MTFGLYCEEFLVNSLYLKSMNGAVIAFHYNDKKKKSLWILDYELLFLTAAPR